MLDYTELPLRAMPRDTLRHSDDRYVVVCCGKVKNWGKWEQSYMRQSTRQKCAYQVVVGLVHTVVVGTGLHNDGQPAWNCTSDM